MACLAMSIMISCQAPDSGAAEVDKDAVTAEIQALEDAYAAASNARDADAQVAYYAEDAQSLPPDEPTIVGKAAILAKAKEEMADGDDNGGSIKFEIVDLFIAGDYATEVGKWVYTDSTGVENTGKFISVFEKRDGKYLCVRDIWNSDSDPDKEDEEEGEAEEE